MFIETSAMIEILLATPRSANLLTTIKGAKTSLSVSPTVEFEASSVLSSRIDCSVEDAYAEVLALVLELGAERMSITPKIGEIAIKAMAQYGKGRGHPAQLNFGDCFSYACAKAAGVPLLYVGQDFARTDLA
jgi:ribonuclease VapC